DGALGSGRTARRGPGGKPVGAPAARRVAAPGPAGAPDGHRGSRALTPPSGPQAPRPRGRPYWMLLAFGLLVLAPPAWAIVGLVGLGVVTAAMIGFRLVGAGRE